MMVSTRHVKKQCIVSTFVEFPPRSFTWYHYGLTKKVVAIADTVVIPQQHYQQKNLVKVTIGFTIKEVEEHGGSDVVTSGSFSLVFVGPS
jgi:hypothetical protein